MSIFQELVSAFASQVQTLKALATVYLPSSQSQSIGARYSKSPLDSEAWEVQKQSRKSGCPLGTNMFCRGDLGDNYIPRRSVYHGLFCILESVEILYRAGFTNVDELNGSNQSPLLLLRPIS
ncbi:hypothetical protein BDW69DRAFT_170677 [Aspergillus filifer]